MRYDNVQLALPLSVSVSSFYFFSFRLQWPNPFLKWKIESKHLKIKANLRVEIRSTKTVSHYKSVRICRFRVPRNVSMLNSNSSECIWCNHNSKYILITESTIWRMLNGLHLNVEPLCLCTNLNHSGLYSIWWPHFFF